jgi:NTE family protein
MAGDEIDFLLVGGGLASANAADTLRREGATGSIQILALEGLSPYHRPRLSKQYLLGTSAEEDLFVHPDEFYRQQDIGLTLGEQVESVDIKSQTVRTASGKTLSYGKLLIATGAMPKPLQVRGVELESVFYLRRKADCDAIRLAAKTGKRAVVLGGSFLGMEIAMSLLALGLDVTVIERGDAILPHLEAPSLCAHFKQLAETKGLSIFLNDTISAIEGNKKVKSVVTPSGRRIPCDLVVISIGVAPSTQFLEGSGIALEEGYVAVDEMLRTNVPNVFAAGDVTKFYDPVFAQRRHVEHWDNAVRQGQLAGRNMINCRHRYDEVSYFYCDIGDIGFDVVGMPTPGSEFVSRGSLEDSSYAQFYLQNDVPRALFSTGRPPDETRLAESLIRYRVNLRDHKQGLGDPDHRLDGISRQTVLILQGGGALGAFECGVVKALEEEQIFPDIVAGVSIGALNGAIIAAHPKNATEALESFWNDLSVATPNWLFEDARRAAVSAQILTFGVPNFFKPRWMPPYEDFFAPWTSYYDTSPMRRLIASYVDFASLKTSPVRLLVGAVNVATAELEVFDSYVDSLTPDHILASGSLPPGFSWSVVDGKAYWDGGIVSNSPFDLVVDRCGPDGKRVFIVDLFSGQSTLPTNMVEVMARRDEIVFSERVRSDLRLREIKDAYRSMVKIILAGLEPKERAKVRQHPRYIQLMGDGLETSVTRFLRPKEQGEPSSRDYDFSDIAIRRHLANGYAIAKTALVSTRESGVTTTGAAATIGRTTSKRALEKGDEAPAAS